MFLYASKNVRCSATEEMYVESGYLFFYEKLPVRALRRIPPKIVAKTARKLVQKYDKSKGKNISEDLKMKKKIKIVFLHQ